MTLTGWSSFLRMAAVSEHLFSELRERLSPAEVAQEYGYAADRAGMISCPFHGEDRHPSMKVYADGFHCFTCQWHGDVVRFVSELTGCKPLEAARELNERFSLGLTIRSGRGQTPEERAQLHRKARERERQVQLRQAFEQWEARAWRILTTRLRQLRQWKREYAPHIMGEPMHPRYAEACRQMEYIEFLCDLLQAGTAADKIAYYIQRQKEVREIERQTERGAAGEPADPGAADRPA